MEQRCYKRACRRIKYISGTGVTIFLMIAHDRMLPDKEESLPKSSPAIAWEIQPKTPTKRACYRTYEALIRA